MRHTNKLGSTVRTFVSTVVAAWAEGDASLIERGFSSRTREDASLGKAVVEVGGVGVAALVEVWEHAHCLDTTVLNLSSGKSLVLAAGPCASESEAQARLLALRSALLNHAGEQSAA